MKTLVPVFCLMLAACSSSPQPPEAASPQEEAVVLAVVPVLNATLPYRVEANDDPKDPLGTRRVPTDRIVVLAQSDHGPAIPGEEAILPGNETLFGSWQTVNLVPVRWSAGLLESPGVIPFDRVNAKIEGDWWKGLAAVAPMVSAKVVLSRPAFTEDKALISAAVETPQARYEVIYRLVKDTGNWVVTNSVTR